MLNQSEHSVYSQHVDNNFRPKNRCTSSLDLRNKLGLGSFRDSNKLCNMIQSDSLLPETKEMMPLFLTVDEYSKRFQWISLPGHTFWRKMSNNFLNGDNSKIYIIGVLELPGVIISNTTPSEKVKANKLTNRPKKKKKKKLSNKEMNDQNKTENFTSDNQWLMTSLPLVNLSFFVCVC